MNIRNGMIAGLGVASLLIALPAAAQANTGSESSSGSKGGSYGTTPGAPSSMGAGAAQNQITGTVEKFDPATNELSLRLKVSDTTQVMKNGQPASLSDIKEGDYVRASFSGSGATLRVQRIDVVSTPPSGAPPSGAAPGEAPSGAPGGAPGPSGSPGSSGRGY